MPRQHLLCVTLAAFASLILNAGLAAAADETLFSSTVPAVASANDPQTVDLGVKLTFAKSGVVKGIRFYKGQNNPGPHTAYFWTAGGKLLAKATFANESASGWQQVLFAKPVPVTAKTTYVASYDAPKGGYAFNQPFFTKSFTNGDITAPGGSNGVFIYNAPGSF